MTGTAYDIADTPVSNTQFKSDGTMLNHYAYTYFDGTTTRKLKTKTSTEGGYAGNAIYTILYNISGDSKETNYRPDGSIRSEACKNSGGSTIDCSLFAE